MLFKIILLLWPRWILANENSLRLDQAQKIIEDQLAYPRKVFGELSLDPASAHYQAGLWQELIKQQIIEQKSAKEVEVKKNHQELFLIRDYPEYKLQGLRLYRCSLQVSVKSMERTKNGWLVSGILTPFASSSFHQQFKDLPYIDQKQRCQSQKKAWQLTYQHAWHVQEK